MGSVRSKKERLLYRLYKINFRVKKEERLLNYKELAALFLTKKGMFIQIEYVTKKDGRKYGYVVIDIRKNVVTSLRSSPIFDYPSEAFDSALDKIIKMYEEV